MRKYVGMVLALICIVTLTACGSDKKITLPELEKITEIEIINVSTHLITPRKFQVLLPWHTGPQIHESFFG